MTRSVPKCSWHEPVHQNSGLGISWLSFMSGWVRGDYPPPHTSKQEVYENKLCDLKLIIICTLSYYSVRVTRFTSTGWIHKVRGLNVCIDTLIIINKWLFAFPELLVPSLRMFNFDNNSARYTLQCSHGYRWKPEGHFNFFPTIILTGSTCNCMVLFVNVHFHADSTRVVTF